MRDIKFRVWVESILEEETGMYTPKYISSWQNGTSWDIDKVYTDDYKFKEDTCKFTLMQYTGLKDKNGVEIYEGDIVQLDDDGELSTHRVMWCIEWDYPAFDLEPSINYTDSNNLSFAACNASMSVAVIGNIYENKELMEKK